MTHEPVTVKEARQNCEPPLTQVDLAEKVEVDQTYISLIERGLRVPSDDLKHRLAKALGVAPSDLRFSEPQPDESVAEADDRQGHSTKTAVAR